MAQQENKLGVMPIGQPALGDEQFPMMVSFFIQALIM